ncbi:hypothetical protein GOP47_0005742 [Adiantum capillus-veneris]|uniref:Uncharacterized protein n=1 Tax=Adiantum capillus-veneris TaxID=13818 RepID=A0A9D4V5Y2_ADICA|nr:hypothetical protein GOP47_0005742 [Adiantum capillus-veneris]
MCCAQLFQLRYHKDAQQSYGSRFDDDLSSLVGLMACRVAANEIPRFFEGSLYLIYFALQRVHIHCKVNSFGLKRSRSFVLVLISLATYMHTLVIIVCWSSLVSYDSIHPCSACIHGAEHACDLPNHIYVLHRAKVCLLVSAMYCTTLCSSMCLCMWRVLKVDFMFRN